MGQEASQGQTGVVGWLIAPKGPSRDDRQHRFRSDSPKSSPSEDQMLQHVGRRALRSVRVRSAQTDVAGLLITTLGVSSSSQPRGSALLMTGGFSNWG